MKLEAFFDKFNQSADAPDAVAKLRVLIIPQRLKPLPLRASAPQRETLLNETGNFFREVGPVGDPAEARGNAEIHQILLSALLSALVAALTTND